MKKDLKQSVMAALAAFIWGTAFVAQSIGAQTMEPFFFMAARSAAAAIFLGVLLLVKKRFSLKKACESVFRKDLLLGGFLAGLALSVASWLQQEGIATTQAGKAGFLTALYIVIVPLLRLIGGKKASWKTWISVIMAVGGFSLLCLNGDIAIASGELLMIGCAFVFALQIIVIDKFGSGQDSIAFSLVQFFTVFILSLFGTLVSESTPISAMRQGMWLILYAGIFSSGIAYTLQIAAQKDCGDPVRISLLLSLESVFSVLAGAVILAERLSVRELSGCAVILIAAILSQLPERKAAGKLDDCS